MIEREKKTIRFEFVILIRIEANNKRKSWKKYHAKWLSMLFSHVRLEWWKIAEHALKTRTKKMSLMLEFTFDVFISEQFDCFQCKNGKSCVNIICMSRNYFFTHMIYYSHSKNASTTLNQEIQFEIVRPNMNLNIFEYCCNRNCNNIHILVREIRCFYFSLAQTTDVDFICKMVAFVCMWMRFVSLNYLQLWFVCLKHNGNVSLS